MTRLRLSPEAEKDLEDIKLHLVSQGGAALARRLLREIRESLHFLAATPGAGHRREDLTNEPVKFWPVFSYVIVYDPLAKPLGVARILHGSQDLQTIFQKRPPRV